MYKARVTRADAIRVNPVGAVVASKNPNMPIQFKEGATPAWLLYTYDRNRRKWTYYLVGPDEAHVAQMLEAARA